ncbi:Dopamine receptor 2 [Holothuria leucospilota]|uniref:Dopamine receptor 2 n=1 Tax=Holothuria leucospilota TaxID=206669 RepID=A0A9Q0YSZ7_HOLLE|nr:Dopamine receptor 2 [Holothuria leucospilota]
MDPQNLGLQTVFQSNFTVINSTSNPLEDDIPTVWWVKCVQGFLTIVLSLGTVFGNFLVIFAVINERRLRLRVTNMFISSLACADFLIGAVVLPFAIYDLLAEGHWIFGRDWCDMWHAFDVLCCTASITNLCVIAIDRFWAITRPMSYQRHISKKVALAMIGIAWLSSSAISFPCILWWRAVEPVTLSTECIFPQDPFYLVLSSFISFYLPSIIMIVLYLQVYRTAVKQVRAIRTGTKKINGTKHVTGMTMRIHQGVKRDKGLNGQNKTRKQRTTRMNKEHKAARTLGIVMGVFIACWFPFFLVNVVAPLCPNCIPIPFVTFPTVTWLGYANSAINPIIYAFSSRTFQHAFKVILCRNRCFSLCRKKRNNFVSRSVTSTSMTWFDASDGKCSENESPTHRPYSLPFIYF